MAREWAESTILARRNSNLRLIVFLPSASDQETRGLLRMVASGRFSSVLLCQSVAGKPTVDKSIILVAILWLCYRPYDSEIDK